MDMAALYGPFLDLLPSGAHILDAGCGSGRDTLYFREHGYNVTAFDASTELAALASQLTGQPVLTLRFQEIEFADAFDGIWACASLLHVSRADIHSVLDKLAGALRLGGVMFLSFKNRDGEWEEGGRFFNGYDVRSFEALVREHPVLSVTSIWTSEDVRPERRSEKWLNGLLRRRVPAA